LKLFDQGESRDADDDTRICGLPEESIAWPFLSSSIFMAIESSDDFHVERHLQPIGFIHQKRSRHESDTSRFTS
jgi:hypothetical protein